MKKLIFILISLAVVNISMANGKGEDKSTKVVVANYTDVLSQISYPQVCREQGIEGTVLVKLSIDDQGQLIDHKILNSPCTDLTLVVEKALPQLQFIPAKKDGKNIHGKLIIPVKFILTNPS